VRPPRVNESHGLLVVVRGQERGQRGQRLLRSLLAGRWPQPGTTRVGTSSAASFIVSSACSPGLFSQLKIIEPLTDPEANGSLFATLHQALTGGA
jgi:hypothetical protein